MLRRSPGINERASFAHRSEEVFAEDDCLIRIFYVILLRIDYGINNCEFIRRLKWTSFLVQNHLSYVTSDIIQKIFFMNSKKIDEKMNHKFSQIYQLVSFFQCHYHFFKKSRINSTPYTLNAYNF